MTIPPNRLPPPPRNSIILPPGPDGPGRLFCIREERFRMKRRTYLDNAEQWMDVLRILTVVLALLQCVQEKSVKQAN